jgi:hypothetical protein
MARMSLRDFLYLNPLDLLDYSCNELGGFLVTARNKYAKVSGEAGPVEKEVLAKMPSVYGGGAFAITGSVVAVVALFRLEDQTTGIDQALAWLGAGCVVGGGFFVVRDARDLMGLNFTLDRLKSQLDDLHALKQRIKGAMMQKKCPKIP